MGNFVTNSYPASCVRVCIDSIENWEIHGRVYTPQMKNTVSFSSLDGLLLKVDHIFDQRGYPLPYYKERTFGMEQGPFQEPMYTTFGEVEENIPRIHQKNGAVLTFLLYVTSRVCGTWRGRLEWTDTDQACSFGSELELIHLLVERIASMLA